MKLLGTEKCPACRARALKERVDVRTFNVHGKSVSVSLKTRVCSNCQAVSTTIEQRIENQAALNSRKSHYGKTLMGEEVLQIRRKYGITQQQAAKLIGKGKIAFCRYESEVSRPDITTNKLLRLALENEAVMKWLADDENMHLPMVELRLAETHVFINLVSNSGASSLPSTAIAIKFDDVFRQPSQSLYKHVAYDGLRNTLGSKVVKTRDYLSLGKFIPDSQSNNAPRTSHDNDFECEMSSL